MPHSQYVPIARKQYCNAMPAMVSTTTCSP